MSEDLKALLTIIAISLPVGLTIGIALRKLKPNWCKKYAKFCLNRQWKVFFLGVVLFGVISIHCFVINWFYFGIFFLLACLLEAFALINWGFKSLTPEMKKRIDESDPTKLFPIDFTKQNPKEEGSMNHQPKTQFIHSLLFLLGFLACLLLLVGMVMSFKDYVEDYPYVIADLLIETGVTAWSFDAKDPLLAQRVILVTTAINEKTAKEVIYKLFYLDAKDPGKPIDLYLRTEGGSLDDAFAIIDTIRSIKSPVNTYAIGGCSSAGTFILASGTGRRYAYPTTIIMVHTKSIKSSQCYSWETTDKIRVEKFWTEEAKLPNEWFPMKDREYYLTAQQAVKFGIIDEIKQ
jgi:ATP-dependent Clp protease protease subunit